MKTKIVSTIIALASVLCISATAQGTAFTFQGWLTNNVPNGNGYHYMRFRLADSAAGTNFVGAPITNHPFVQARQFQATLDFGNVFDGSPRWLEVSVAKNAANTLWATNTLVELTPVPYAIFAQTTSNLLGGLSVTNLTGTIANSQLSNSSVTVTAGTGLSGGGSVALGDSITLNVNADTNSTANTIVQRDAAGDFAAGIITANLNGNALTATSAGTAVNAATATNFSGSLAGDVTGTQGATVVSTVGGQTAANVSNTVVAVGAATSANTASALVQRDGSGSFSAGTITAALNGNAATATSAANAGTATNFSGSLAGDVTGTQGATVVSTVGGQTAVNVSNTVVTVGAATSANTASALVQRDGSGNFSAGIITAALNGNASTATSATSASTATFATTAGTATNFSGSLAGDVTGTQGATVVSTVGGQTAVNVSNTVVTVGAATTNNTPNTIVVRDGSGDFSAGTITANLNGNAATATFATIAGTATNFSGAVAGDVTGNQGTTVVASVGGQTALAISNTVVVVNGATSSSTANSLVSRDGSGDFSANSITLAGNLNLPNPATIYSGGAVIVYAKPPTGTFFAGPYAGNPAANVGIGNTAVGYAALSADLDGFGNTAIGTSAMLSFTNGNYNAALGLSSLQSLVTGDYNTAAGEGSLQYLTNGTGNISVGTFSGSGLLNGDNNIYIGNGGVDGESGIIRIGSVGTHSATYLAGDVIASGAVFSNGVDIVSDRNAKENFATVDPQEVLAKVVAMSVSKWNYKTAKDAVHIGPVAQDFHAAFDLNGKDDRHISVLDEGGVALAAIKGLNQKLDEKDAQIQKQNAEIQSLQQSIAELKTAVSQFSKSQAK